MGQRKFMLAMAAVLLAASLPPTQAQAQDGVRRVAVEFRVRNVNRTALPCTADGRTYRVRGELVAPAGRLPGVVTVALHEFSFGRFFWSLPGHPAHDLAAAMAKAGHAWLVVDRLGYDGSDHPPGAGVCLGSQADIVAQIVRAVASGDYAAGAGTRGPAFRRVALAGHSVGGGIAELAAHSFPTLPLAGLALLAWADRGYTPETIRQSVEQGQDCATGGERPETGAPAGYAYFGRTPERFQANMFFDAEPAVVAAATARRNRDPCGDNASLARLAVVNGTRIGRITLPVLLLFGDRDPVFTGTAGRDQAAAFSSSSRVEFHLIPRTAHALALERSAPLTRAHLLDWLRRL